jgi:hypothetical protein
MNKLRSFEASVFGNIGNLDLRVRMRVDNIDLIGRIRETEHPFAEREGAPALAGNYTWPLLTPRLVRLLDGARPGAQRVEGVLLNCECGWASCWPLSVRVRVLDRFVIWQDLRQLKRLSRWSYGALGPLRFAQAEYFDQVAKIRHALSQLPRAVEVRRLASRTSPASDEATCAF